MQVKVHQVKTWFLKSPEYDLAAVWGLLLANSPVFLVERVVQVDGAGVVFGVPQ